MANVLIRDVADEDLALLKEVAAEEGSSLQATLAEILRQQAVWVRRQRALAVIAARQESQPSTVGMTDEEHEAMLEEMKAHHEDKWVELWADRDR